MTTKRIAITPGEPAGVGPDLVIQLAQRAWPAELVVCADPTLLTARAKKIGLPIQLKPYQPSQPPKPQEAGTLTIVPFPLVNDAICGKLDEQNSSYQSYKGKTFGQGIGGSRHLRQGERKNHPSGGGSGSL